jgi:hypothetical protein
MNTPALGFRAAAALAALEKSGPKDAEVVDYVHHEGRIGKVLHEVHVE